MGATAGSCTTMNYEVKLRIISLSSVYVPSRKRLFANRSLSISARSYYADSLLHSRLLFDAGTWKPLSSSAAVSIRRAYITPYRTLAGLSNEKDEKFSNVQVLVAVQRPTISEVLAIKRLKYFRSFIVHSSDEHFRLIALMCGIKDTWLHQVLQDTRCMWNNNENMFTSMPDPLVEFGPWIQVAVHDSLKWK